MSSCLDELIENMRVKHYQISYDASNAEARREIDDLLKHKGASRILESTWIIKTSDSAQTLLVAMPRNSEVKYFISEVINNISTNIV